MTAPAFLDTNILCYTKDSSDPKKHRTAIKLVEELLAKGTARVSAQVVSEFYVFLKRIAQDDADKMAARLSAQALLQLIPIPITAELQLKAWEIEDRYRLSWWDAMILAAAKMAKCEVLYSEDLQGQQLIEGIRVINPFEPPPDQHSPLE